MARSRRKNPGFSLACVGRGEMKNWKASVNRCFRRKEKQLIQVERFEELPEKTREISEIWASPSDGKIFIESLILCEKNPDRRREWLRDFWKEWNRK